MTRLWVLYDASCGFCSRCRAWLEAQPKYLPMRFLETDDPALEERFPGLRALVGADELAVVGDDGAVYAGTKAWVVCLWALRDYRSWARRLASPLLRPLARRLYGLVSGGRYQLSEVLGLLSDRDLHDVLAAERDPRCQGPECRLPEPSPSAAPAARRLEAGGDPT